MKFIYINIYISTFRFLVFPRILGCLEFLSGLGRDFGSFGGVRVFRRFWGFRVSGVWVRVSVVGFNFGFGRTNTTRNVIWGSILTPSRKKCSKQLQK